MSDEVKRSRMEAQMEAQRAHVEAQRRAAMADDPEMQEQMRGDIRRQREERVRIHEEERMRDPAYEGERQRPNIPPEEMPESLRPNNASKPEPEPVPAPRSQPQSQPQPEPSVPDFKMSAPQQSSAPRRNSTQSMREQMRANRVNQQQHTTTTSQTEEYVEQSVSEGQKTSPVNQPNNPKPNNTTTIIGGSSDNGDTDGKKKGFQFNKKSGWIIIALIAGLLVGAYVIFGKGSGGGEGTAENDPNQQIPNQDELEWINPDDINLAPSYGPEEIEQLRAAGYTGPEIEKYSSQGIDVNDLLRQSAAARDAYRKQANKDLYDVASPEFKHYIGQTWLTLPKRDDIQDWKILGFQYTEKKNLDYEKIDVYGNQLFLKIYLDDKDHVSWFYLNVTPEEWNSLNDSGNVVVTYTYATHIVGDDVINGVEDKQNIYIIDASLEIIENKVN